MSENEAQISSTWSEWLNVAVEVPNVFHNILSQIMIILVHRHRKITQAVSKISFFDTRSSQVTSLNISVHD